MNQEQAVQAKMRDIKYKKEIPEQYQGFLRQHFDEMYAMGFDEGRKYNFKNTKRKHTQVLRIDEQWHETQFYSVAEAARKSKCTTDTIFEALKDGKRHKGYFWRRVD